MILESLHFKLKCTLLFIGLGFIPSSIAQNYQIGHISTTFVDASRNNRAIAVEIYYPADNPGDNVLVAGSDGLTFSPLAFGHGFVMGWNAYQNIWESLVPQGFIMIFPKTEGGIAPSHSEFGKDLAFVIAEMENLGALESSIFFQKISETNAVMGHSMGGGAAFLAAQQDANIAALVTLAPAETNPSAIAAAGTLTLPALIIAGANDCVTPPNSNQLPMFEAMQSDCKTYISITGGSHCQMADSNFLCQFGETTCSPSPTISRETQHQILSNYMGDWLKSQLQSDCEAGAAFDGLLESDSAVSFVKSCEFCTPLLVGENLETVSLLVYPNPFDAAIAIENKSAHRTELSIYDVFSRLIFRKSFTGNMKLDTSDFPSGIYFYSATDSRSFTKKGKLIKR